MVFNRYNQQNEIMIGVCLKCEQRNYGSKLQALATLQAFKDLGKEYRILKYDLSQCTSNRIGNELLVFSKEIEFSTSIQYLKNPVML